MNWKEHKKRLLKDPGFRKEYEALEPEYKLAGDLIRLRLSRGLTQEELARRINTKQSAIARLESAGSLPSLSTVKRVAEALDADLYVAIQPRGSRAPRRDRSPGTMTAVADPRTPGLSASPYGVMVSTRRTWSGYRAMKRSSSSVRLSWLWAVA